MAEGSDEAQPNLPMLGGQNDPSRYQSQSAKERFAVAKFYGMGSDGEWTRKQIADALDVTVRTVSRYLNESSIGKEVREMLAVTEAEWRLDMAIQLRREVQRLEEIEQELLERKTAVPTGYETKSVEGTPTGDRNIRLPDDSDTYRLKLPVPTDFETVTDYGPDLERVQKEKRQYLSQIADLLGLNEADKGGIDETLATRHEEVKILEVRTTDDPYPEAEPLDMADADAEDVKQLVDDAQVVETVESAPADDADAVEEDDDR